MSQVCTVYWHHPHCTISSYWSYWNFQTFLCSHCQCAKLCTADLEIMGEEEADMSTERRRRIKGIESWERWWDKLRNILWTSREDEKKKKAWKMLQQSLLCLCWPDSGHICPDWGFSIKNKPVKTAGLYEWMFFFITQEHCTQSKTDKKVDRGAWSQNPSSKHEKIFLHT